MSQLSDPMTEPNVLFWECLWLGVFLANPGHFCGWGATLWRSKRQLVKIERLVADVTSARSLDHGSFACTFYSERISEVIAKLSQKYDFYLVIT